MKTKSPLSIRIIYWFTNVILGLLSLISVAVIVFNILLYTSFFGNDLQLHSQLPVEVNFLEMGNLNLNGQDIKVELVEATSRIHFFNTPIFLAKIFGLALLLALSFIVSIMWTFRKFIVNVKNGRTFNIANIKLLKRLAYIMTGLWFYTVLYNYSFYYYIATKLEFEYISISKETQDHGSILVIALFIWVLAHIFISGLKLQEEQDLTI